MIPTNISIQLYDDLCKEKKQLIHNLDLFKECRRILVDLLDDITSTVNEMSNRDFQPTSINEATKFAQQSTKFARQVKKVTSTFGQLSSLYVMVVTTSNEYTDHMGIERVKNSYGY